MTDSLEGVIRVRMSSADAHYAGGLVDGAQIVKLFGDAITELLIRRDGDEGLSRALKSEFLAPVRAGDYLEIRAKIVAVGKSSRTIECTAHKIIELVGPNDSAANVLAEPILVATATDVAIVPVDKQRRVNEMKSKNNRAIALLLTCLVVASGAAAADAQRARDVGIPLDGKPGALNAITDVAGIEVGQVTLISGDGKLKRGQGPVRTGVTAIVPRGKNSISPVFAGWATSNSAGEMTGTTWLEERGYFDGPVMITNTHSVGVVRDAVVGWIVDRKWPGSWYTPVVAETYDGYLNDTDGFHVKTGHALEALKNARGGPVEEGNVGGGTGMVCFGFKGGIGTSSRVITTPIGTYTVGVLVQCNFGLMPTLRVAGVKVGEALKDRYTTCTALPPSPYPTIKDCTPGPEKPGDGSMIVVIATDAPLLPHQLKRLAKRPAHAMGRLGDTGRETSGDIFIAFSTANPQIVSEQREKMALDAYPNGLLNPLFEGAVQAVEESILNALIAAKTMTGRDGHRVYALPHDEVRALLQRHGMLAK